MIQNWECLLMFINVGKTRINHPFGNGLYHLFSVIWGMVYYCLTHIIGISTWIESSNNWAAKEILCHFLRYPATKVRNKEAKHLKPTKTNYPLVN